MNSLVFFSFVIPYVAGQNAPCVGCRISDQENDASTLLQTKTSFKDSQPMIGILTQPMSQQLSQALSIDKRSTYISASYVSLYESAGARVVPVPFDLPRSGLRSLFQQINGLVIPGNGGVAFDSEEVHPRIQATVKYLLELAMAASDKGDPFPIQGICLGFEKLALLTAENDSVVCGHDCFASSGVPLPLNLKGAAAASKLFAAFPPELKGSLQQKNLTFNSHHDGILLESFMSSRKLTDFWDLLSTSKDLHGREFVSTMEAKRYPITALQWHPEKPAFESAGLEGLKVPHSEEAIRIGWLIARDFVVKARSNNNVFSSRMAMEDALIDKTKIRRDPREFFSLVYVTGVQGESTYPEPVDIQHLLEYNETDSLGIFGLPWHPMSVEIEMVECPRIASPVSKMLAAESPAVRAQSMAEIGTWLQLTGKIVSDILLEEFVASPNLLQQTNQSSGLRALHIKNGHDDDDVLHQWNWEKEKTGVGLLELASPIDLSEDEAKFAIGMSKQFIGKFSGVQYSSFQSHVEARCLLSDDRIIGLLLVWEKYHDALQRLIQVRWRGPDFARNLSVGNPPLLHSLQARWAQGDSGQGLETLFKQHEVSIENLKDDRDGFRNFAVNVCHLLNIKCCRDCPKNRTPKFGGVEFRMFNTEFGAPMRLAMMLFQRLVQRSCVAPLAELRNMALSAGDAPATDASALFEFLSIDAKKMKYAFEQSGADRWLWFCERQQ